jgi:hypothetical protein
MEPQTVHNRQPKDLEWKPISNEYQTNICNKKFRVSAFKADMRFAAPQLPKTYLSVFLTSFAHTTTWQRKSYNQPMKTFGGVHKIRPGDS